MGWRQALEASPFAAYDHPTLIDKFYESEGDPNIGKELAIRLFAHAGVGTADPNTAPLIGRDGAQVQGEEGPLVLADYVNYAAVHHFRYVEGILGFLLVHPGEEEYEAGRTAMIARLEGSGS